MITFLKRLAAAIPTPGSGKVTLFVDADSGQPKFKDDAGAVGDFAGPPGATTWDGLTGDPVVVPIKAYTLATLPDATEHANGLLVVSDHTAGSGVCVSDGTDWIDVATGSAVA